MKITVKNWSTFQHYNKRNPPWIKLHKKLIDDCDFQCLHDASKVLAFWLWLLASEYTDGVINQSVKQICYRLRTEENRLIESIKELENSGLISVEWDNASNVLATCYTRDRDRDIDRVIPTTTEIVLNDRNNSETMMRNCFEIHYSKLESLYPHANLPAEMETCIAHYAKHPVIDPYPVILKWLNRVPKGKTLSLVSVHDQKRAERQSANAEACKIFAGADA